MPRSRSALLLAVAVAAAACGNDGARTPQEAFLAAARGELDELLGEEAPDYGDEELLAYGERACANLEDVPDGETLRRTIEDASVGATDAETLQIAQATVVVTTAARHLCPEHGERLGILEHGSSA